MRKMTSSLKNETNTDGAISVIRRGLKLTPDLARGLWITIVLAIIATLGQVIVPIAVQKIVDEIVDTNGAVNMQLVINTAAIATGILVLTSLAKSLMNRRLFYSAGTALTVLRTRAFRHIHNLSLLTQNTEKKGSLVSRVTSDIDTIELFISFGGIMLLVMSLQLLLATSVMFFYSIPLTLLVWLCYLPTFLIINRLTKIMRQRYQKVRSATGEMLGAISESLVGAATLRAYGVEEASRKKSVESVNKVRKAQFTVQVPTAGTVVLGEIADGIAVAVVIVAGIYLGTGFELLTAGELIAFIFLISLFAQPVRMLIEMVNEAQNAVAGWGRVLEVLDTKADIADPGGSINPHTGQLQPAIAGATELPIGPLGYEIKNLNFSYRDDKPALRKLNLEIAPQSTVAIVGETGSGKTTLAKLLTRLMDPDSGEIKLGGVDLAKVPFASLRSRVILVPQEGFLFAGTLRQNLLFADPQASDTKLLNALDELGLTNWYEGLKDGLDTEVGQRGESLSAGERQLVALARAYLVDPDVIVMDEATSAVDPVTDVRIQEAIEGLSRGRTTITIAHRLSTAERADAIIVLDKGKLAEYGKHAQLVNKEGGIYARLHHSWVAHRNSRI